MVAKLIMKVAIKVIHNYILHHNLKEEEEEITVMDNHLEPIHTTTKIEQITS